MSEHFVEFYPNLYVGKRIHDPELVKWRLAHGAGEISVYVIARSLCKSDQFDIMHCANLKQKYYKDKPAYVYGIAAGKSEAYDILTQISREAIEAGMPGDMLGYLENLNQSI